MDVVYTQLALPLEGKTDDNDVKYAIYVAPSGPLPCLSLKRWAYVDSSALLLGSSSAIAYAPHLTHWTQHFGPHHLSESIPAWTISFNTTGFQ